jgi:hypothetical protein
MHLVSFGKPGVTLARHGGAREATRGERERRSVWGARLVLGILYTLGPPIRHSLEA